MQPKVGDFLLFTEPLQRWLQRKKIDHPWKVGEILVVQEIDERKFLTPVKIGKADAAGVFIPEKHAAEGHVRWQIVQLAQMADNFFRMIAEAAGAVFIGIQRVPKEGWLGGFIMTDHPDQPEKKQWVVLEGFNGTPAVAYARRYALAVHDAQLIDADALAKAALNMTMSLVGRYEREKWTKQEVEDAAKQ